MMDNCENLEILNLIIDGLESINSRKQFKELRANYSNNGFIKQSFDSRRVSNDQIFPRKALKNFSRSEPFISKAASKKINNLMFLNSVIDDIKKEYGSLPEWDDSNCRVLQNHLNVALRTNIKDGDFSENQKGLGDLNYLEELLYLRYRLDINGLKKYFKDDLKKILLSKDEEMLNKDILSENNVEIKKHDIVNKPYDQLINTLFDGVKASVENKKVKRKITIEVEDEIVN